MKSLRTLYWYITAFLRKLLKCGAASDNLYVVVETLDAEANETAGMTIRFDLTFMN